MIRKLMTTTAIVGLLASGAYAQTNTAPVEPANRPAAAQPATPGADGAVTEATVSATGHLASNLIGETVYNGTGDDAENVGEVNDLVVNADGQVDAIVIGVGGFLGIGEKDVAVDYDTIDWAERDGDRWIVISATTDQLKELPEFDRSGYNPVQPVAANDPAVTPAPVDGTAQAPVTATPPADQQAAAPMQQPADQTAQAPAATDDTQTAAIDRSTLQPLDTASIRAEELVGTTVYGANEENVGEVGDIVLSQDGQVESIIVNVGGFLGVGEKEVAVGMDNLSFLASQDGDKYLYTAFTKEQLEAAPEYDEATYAERRDDMRIVVPN